MAGLPYNLQKKTYCVVQSSCTAISCCSDNPDMEMTFTWYIDIDVCNHVLKIGIEEYTAQFSLLNFPFSKVSINVINKTLIDIEINNCFGQEPFRYVILFFFCRKTSEFCSFWGIQNQVCKINYCGLRKSAAI